MTLAQAGVTKGVVPNLVRQSSIRCVKRISIFSSPGHLSRTGNCPFTPGLFSSQQILCILRSLLRSIALRHLAFLMF
jgi:hypothetical protein